ncbi:MULTISPECIES: helix-turn-helix transcriptional regulator [unclassified Kitasatospora]|uniref:helix-turn-helix domain-containing protein n=1 Tax=unclassified Kitasatospora TaxID=2633591 RepID=UPI00070A1C9E|nr:MULTISPECIES: helix-turn-helix transcriptional regulator [unclassified Kitasatospora]KQV12423.1 XRE family transcriptional regulator [Kitasatospora sp. Root107]KRB66924.1 XRE family transcriptional regulator [Kitasatospora sp. Root187]
MAVSASSSVQRARQDLADRLGETLRESGLKGRELAAACGWYPSKVSRLLNGHTPPSEDDIRQWCRACGAEDRAADLIASVRAVAGMFVEWRRMERTGLRQAQEARRPLYERTHRFRAYSSWLVPGLLQTRGYTASVLRGIQRRRVLVDDVDAAVAARMERQHILYEGDHQFAFLIEESVLRSCLAGADVMTGQLNQLATVGSLPNVSLGVVPMGLDRSRMPVEGFWIFDAAQVNVELVSGYLTITQPSEVTAYAEAFAELAEQAVYGPDARALITSAIAALG